MFEKIRKPGKTFVSYIIFGLICFIFIFIGVPFQQSSPLGSGAMEVNGQVVSLAEYQNYYNILQSQAGEQKEDLLRKQTLEALLTAELTKQSAETLQMNISREEKKDQILSMPFGQEEGRWTQSRYRSFLKARGLSPAQFEERVGQDLLNRRFQRLFEHAFFLSSVEGQKVQELKKFKTKISYIQFATTSLSLEESLQLEELVQGEDSSLLDQFIKEKNWEWRETEMFDLSRTGLPGLASHKILLDKLWAHWPETGRIRTVISSQDQSFILKVLHFSQEDQTEKKQDLPDGKALLSEVVRVMRGRTLFLSYMDFKRTKASVQINPRLGPSS